MVRLQEQPIDVDSILSGVRTDADGAVALFVGTVRDHNRGRKVLRLEYEAYAEMAIAEMEKLEAAALERFAVTDVALVHRTGRLAIGEASVVVAAAAAHRGDAFDACRFVIDSLKRSVPIWKKEVFEGGEVWIEGAGEAGSGPAGDQA